MVAKSAATVEGVFLGIGNCFCSPIDQCVDNSCGEITLDTDDDDVSSLGMTSLVRQNSMTSHASASTMSPVQLSPDEKQKAAARPDGRKRRRRIYRI